MSLYYADLNSIEAIRSGNSRLGVVSLAISRFASAVSLSASATRAFASATSSSNRAFSPAWSRWSFQLFHNSLMPKNDSPATPMTTITPKMADQISSHLISASSDDLSISAEATFYECFALVVVVIGVVSLAIPVFALLCILERRHAKKKPAGQSW